VAAVLLALTLGTAAEVWVATEGLVPQPDASPAACSAEAFAAALRSQRPGVLVRPWHPGRDAERPPDGALSASLTERGDVVTLDVHGARVTLSRALSANDRCERNVTTSALIVDGALDELMAPARAPTVDSLAPPVPFYKQLHLSASAGAGGEQGMFTFVPAFAGEVALRYRYVQLTVDFDAALGSSEGFGTSGTPGTEKPTTGTFAAAAAYSGGLGAGFVPRLGPGRLDVAVAAGLSFASGAASSPTPSLLFQQSPASTTEPFVVARLGYALDLPAGLFVAVRAEERLTRPATFEVGGALFQTSGQDTVTTRLWTFGSLAFIGYHFF
jgi:hypothetical protein